MLVVFVFVFVFPERQVMRKRTHKIKQEHKIRPGQALRYGKQTTQDHLVQRFLLGQADNERVEAGDMLEYHLNSNFPWSDCSAWDPHEVTDIPSEQCSLPLLPSRALSPFLESTPISSPALAMLLPHDHPSRASLTSLKFRCGLGF